MSASKPAPAPPPTKAKPVASVPAMSEEDRLDLEDGLAALQEFKASGEKAIPLDEVLAGHGLTRADLSD